MVTRIHYLCDVAVVNEAPIQVHKRFGNFFRFPQVPQAQGMEMKTSSHGVNIHQRWTETIVEHHDDHVKVTEIRGESNSWAWSPDGKVEDVFIRYFLLEDHPRYREVLERQEAEWKATRKKDAD